LKVMPLHSSDLWCDVTVKLVDLDKIGRESMFKILWIFTESLLVVNGFPPHAKGIF
jgi:hypothetical protein